MGVLESGINVASMEFLKPVTVPQSRDATSEVLQILATVDRDLKNIHIQWQVGNEDVARARVEFDNRESWLTEWSRNAYLVQARLDALKKDNLHTPTHKIYGNLAYKLFAARVQYSSPFRVMQEVCINTEVLECAATIRLDPTLKGSFYASPYWLDGFAHVAGFLVNNLVDLEDHCFYMCPGWGSWRFDRDIDPSSDYRVYVKMHETQRDRLSGTVSIFQNDAMCGEIQDLRFQKISLTTFDLLLEQQMQSASRSRKDCMTQGARNLTQANSIQDLKDKHVQRRRSNLKEPSNTDASHSRPRKDDLDTTIDAISLRDLLGKELGIRSNDLDDDSLLADLGVDSMLTLSLFSRIKDLYGIDVSLSSLPDNATVAHLENAVFDRMSLVTPATGDASRIDEHVSSPRRSDTVTGSSATQAAIIRAFIAQSIGVTIADLEEANDLTELGVDSLMSLTIVETLSAKLGRSISAGDLSGSITDIERNLGLQHLSGQENITKHTSHDRDLSFVPLSKHRLSYLIQGDPQTACRMLFLLPDGSGAATSYAQLPEIDPTLCVYALNSPFLNRPQEFTSVESISCAFYEEIRLRQPHGPYAVGGWSAGGYYAYEVAKRILQEGETVDKIILIDSPCRTHYETLPLPLLDFLLKEKLIGQEGIRPPDRLIQHFRAGIVRIAEYIPEPICRAPVAVALPQVYIIWGEDGANDDVDFKKEGLDSESKISRLLLHKRKDFAPQGWQNLLPGSRIWLASVPGHHFQIVFPPYVSWHSGLLVCDLTDVHFYRHNI